MEKIHQKHTWRGIHTMEEVTRAETWRRGSLRMAGMVEGNGKSEQDS